MSDIPDKYETITPTRINRKGIEGEFIVFGIAGTSFLMLDAKGDIRVVPWHVMAGFTLVNA